MPSIQVLRPTAAIAIVVTCAMCVVGHDELQARNSWFVVETRGDVPPADIALVEEALVHGTAALNEYFDDPSLVARLETIAVRVILHAQANDRANEYTATARTGTLDGNVESYFATIDLLAPSSYPPGLLTSAGEPKDAAYFQRLALHELSTVPLDVATRSKPEGWRFRSAPAWFIQGYEEYLGMICAPGEIGADALDHRTAMVRDDPDSIDGSFGLDVRDAYITGAVLVRFMHEQYGTDRVRNILTSREPTFGRAVSTTLGTDVDAFLTDFRAWLEAH